MDELPDTQTQEDCIEATQELQPMVPWGRLASCLPTLQSIDLFEQTYSFGRAPNCNILLNKSDFPSILNISKIHFKLYKDDDIVYVDDLSKNGTFINDLKIGKNKSHIINNNDIIAVGHPSTKVFSFNCNLHGDYEYPSEMRRKFYISKKIGRGAFGEVRLAHHKTNFQKFAVKKICKGRSSLSDDGRLTQPQKVKTEIEILTTFSYTFIIQMHEVFETDREVYLLLEYMEGGELTQKILSLTPFPEAEVKFIFYQISLAVRFLHLNGITHRDLKPENVLLHRNVPYPMVKVSDFGLSKIMDEVSLMETVCGTINYVAPEVLNCYEKYNKKVDIWSLGVVLFYMLSRSQPFRGSNRDDVAKSILTGKITWDSRVWKSVSPLAKELTKKMLTIDPQCRISTQDIFRHDWIEKDVVMKCKVDRLITQSFEQTSSSEEILPLPKRPRRSEISN